jgi:4-hydroxy-tetrahydrodipicolinate reductase
MKVLLAGYGRMGKEIEKVVKERGHQVAAVIDLGSGLDNSDSGYRDIDVAIEFTIPESAPGMISRMLRLSLPVVSGTTGWLHRYEEMATLAVENNTSFIHSSNFSPGVYLLSRINSELAKCIGKIGGYKPSVEEVHHKAKLDSPSGTAIMLAEQIVAANKLFQGWTDSDKAASEEMISVASLREGDVPGTHHVIWTSPEDSITISHEAFGRRGFAVGAVMAAEYIASRTGVFNLEQVFGF